MAPFSSRNEEAFQEIDGELQPKFGVINMEESVYSTPIVANNVLFISNKSKLYAIAPEE